MFEAVGIGEPEERLYRLLLERPSMSTDHIAQHLQLDDAQVRALLGSLETKGLVSKSFDATQPGFVAAPPNVALEQLALLRRRELEDVRRRADQLMDLYWSARDQQSEQLVEIIHPDAVLARFEQLQRSAIDEVVVFDRPPYIMSGTDHNDTEIANLHKGVRYRCLYDRTALDASRGRIESSIGAGEDARVARAVPMKLAIADRRLALVPLGGGDSDGAIMVHRSSLLDALVACFEALWAAATPLTLVDDTPQADPRLGDQDRHLMSMLLAGLSDQAIAHRLNVSSRTLHRRIKRLMDLAGAETRLQLGWHAARAGWPQNLGRPTGMLTSENYRSS